MRTSKVLLTIILILASVCILISWQPVETHLKIPESFPLVQLAKSQGLIDESKIVRGNYEINKILQSPDILGRSTETRLGLDLKGELMSH